MCVVAGECGETCCVGFGTKKSKDAVMYCGLIDLLMCDVISGLGLRRVTGVNLLPFLLP